MATSKVLSIVLKATDKATKPIRDVVSRIQSVSTSMVRVDKLLGRSAKTMFRTLTSLKGAVVAFAALTIGSRLVADLAMVEEKAAEIATLLPDLGRDGMRELSFVVQDLAVEGAQKIEDEFKAAYDAISAGVEAANLVEFLRTANKLAVGGVTDVTTSVDLLTSVMNAYGIATGNAEDVADIFFTTVRKGKTTVGELGDSLFQVAPAANDAGLGLDQVGASLAALTAAGVPTRVATTQLRAMILELGKAGTKASEEFRQIAGVGFRDFIKQGESVADAMRLIRERADTTGRSVTDLFSSVEGGLAASVLGGQGFDLLLDTMREMEARAGATDKAFATMADTLGFRLRQAGQAVRVLFTTSLSDVSGPLKGIADLVTNVSKVIVVSLRAIREGGELGREAEAILSDLFGTLTRVGQEAVFQLFNILTITAMELVPTVAELLGRKIGSGLFEIIVGSLGGAIERLWWWLHDLTGLDAYAQFARDMSTGITEAQLEIQKFFGVDSTGATQRLRDALTEQGSLLSRVAKDGYAAISAEAEDLTAHMDRLTELADRMGERFAAGADEAKKAVEGVANIPAPAPDPTAMERFFTSARTGLEEWAQTLQTTDQFVRSFVGNVANAFAGNLSNAIADVISGTRSLKDAMRDFATSTLRLVTQLILQFLILRALAAAFGVAGQVGATTAAAATPTVAGANRGGLIGYGKVHRFAGGGVVPGPRVPYDVTPALLTPGEFVFSRDAVDRIGLASLMRANRGAASASFGSGDAGGTTVYFEQNVTIDGGRGGLDERAARQFREETADALRSALERRPGFRQQIRKLIQS